VWNNDVTKGPEICSDVQTVKVELTPLTEHQPDNGLKITEQNNKIDFYFNQQYIYIYIFLKKPLILIHSYMFRHIGIILREFRSCTLLQLGNFILNKIH